MYLHICVLKTIPKKNNKELDPSGCLVQHRERAQLFKET